MLNKGLLLAGLLTCVGCMSDKHEKLPTAPTGNKTVSTKPADDSVPSAVSKLLPPEQLTDRNAKAQSKVLEETLRRERQQLDKTESAKAE
jgi:hypothetical protein